MARRWPCTVFDASARVVGLRHHDVDAQHRQLLGHVAVDGLLDGLRLDAQPVEVGEHAERPGGVAAEPTPLRKQERADTRGCRADLLHQLGPGGAFGERLGAVVLAVGA